MHSGPSSHSDEGRGLGQGPRGAAVAAAVLNQDPADALSSPAWQGRRETAALVRPRAAVPVTVTFCRLFLLSGPSFPLP